MTAFTFANDINTQLAGAISSSATSITLASALNLPASIPAGTNLVITLRDAATRANTEIVYATAITGTTLTVVRGQEGTTAQAWAVGDYAYSGVTAGQMQGVSSGSLIGVQKFTSSGTYTPTPGTNSIIVEGVAGGGGGGGCPATTGTQQSSSGGGQSGTYGLARFTSGFSGGLAVTIGSAGTGGATGSNAGVAGGATSLGSIFILPGGPGGLAGLASTSTIGLFPNTSTPTTITVSGGTLLKSLGPTTGDPAIVLSLTVLRSGGGGDSPFGRGGQVSVAPLAGQNASGNGAGGSGAAQTSSNAGQPGGNGTAGVLVIYELA